MVVVAALGGSACQSASEAPDPEAAAPDAAPAASPEVTSSAPAASPSATPSPSADPVAAEAVAAYQAYWEAVHRASMDPAAATRDELARHATGEALESVERSVLALRTAGRAFRRPPETIAQHRVSFVELAGDRAVVRDCYTDDGWVEVVATGERSNEGVGTQLGRGELVQEDGRWKVAYTFVEQGWEGVAGCALEPPS